MDPLPDTAIMCIEDQFIVPPVYDPLLKRAGCIIRNRNFIAFRIPLVDMWI